MDVWIIAWTLAAVVVLTVTAALLFAMRTEKGRGGSCLRRALSTVPPNARMSLAVLSIACAVLAQKGTNEPPRGVSAPYSENSDLGPRSGGDMPVQTLTTTDYETGFVLAEARYGEHRDFSPTEGAEICGDWRAFGASCDWFKTDMGGFSFPFGTNVVNSLMIYSFGEARAAPRDFSRRIMPFRAPLEIAPESNWQQLTNSPSLFWQMFTSTNTYLMTWQNVSLDGSPEHLVSFQAEIYADGCVEFRYDLSLAGCDVVTNAEVALLSGSGGFCTNGIPAGLTTLRFQRLDPAGASDSDPDGDGISTDGEVFVYHTNPYCSDTDYDGLSDYEEIFVYNTNPLDPHSLGNMLVSAARQDYGLQYDKYFMLNAAVPVEAYDPVDGVTTNSYHDMTPAEWRPYEDRVRSTHWYELFLSNPSDERGKLTWKGRFKDVDNTINFYSSKDEVVANGGDKVDKLLSRDFAWYNQEQAKGSLLVSFNPQAGWKFNDYYFKEEFLGYENGEPQYRHRRYTPGEAALVVNTNLMAAPFFKDFRDGRIYGDGGSAFLQANDMVRWYALSHGIPAESYAAGANPVPKWGQKRNIDMAIDCNTKAQSASEGGSVPLSEDIDSTIVDWSHSYFIGNSLFDTKKLYGKIVERIKQTNAKENDDE